MRYFLWDAIDLITQLRSSDWKLIFYHWEPDADTGAAFFTNENGIRNASQASHISHMHGIHLGDLLDRLAPSLKKVHFIAHSAGDWVARAAARKLLSRNASVEVQVTLLDPYMPSQAGSDSVLGVNLWSWSGNISQWTGSNRINKLENYYATSDGAPGTSSEFNWRTEDKNREVGEGVILFPTGFYGHSGPIEYYAKTVGLADPSIDIVPNNSRLDSNPSHGLGWAESMFWNELETNDPFAGTPIDGFAAWRSSLWYGNYNVDNWPWIYHDEHGWQFVSENSAEEVIFVWDFGLGEWLFLNENTYRWMFIFDGNAGWIWTFDTNVPGSRFFQRLDDGSFFSVPAGLLVD